MDSLILPLEIDLTANDGTTDYGIDEGLGAACALKVGLITCDQYRKYRRYIPDVNKYWWTATAWTCNPADTFTVCYVNDCGVLSNCGVTHAYPRRRRGHYFDSGFVD